MKNRSQVLKTRTAILLSGTMALIVGSVSGAWAADLSPITPPPVYQGWYFTGDLDVGGRVFIQRPPTGFGFNSQGNFLLPFQTGSRAKFQEYGEILPGVFLDQFYVETGSNDGRYNANVWGFDVGYNAQSYGLDLAQNGFQYFNLGWDQTPHLYSTSAKSLFTNIGSTNLIVPVSIQNALQAQYNNAALNTAAGLAARNSINNIVETNATNFDIETRRDTFSVGYRITPTPEWDFNVFYAHEDKTGTKPGTLNYTFPAGFPSNVIGLPVPINETTQKPEASGEYVGSSAWGRYTVQLAYNGSLYNNNISQLIADNPFSNTGAQTHFGTLQVPLAPSNQAHTFTAQGATDVPLFKSRFTTTNQWTRMTQDDAFQNTSNNGLIADALPVASLNGRVNTFLTNNVLTSKLDYDMSNSLRVRYYERNNNTPVPATPYTNQVFADSELSAGPFTPQYLSYNKTNIDEDLRWTTPLNWLTVGAGYGFERWNRTNRFTGITNQNTGLIFADARPTDTMNWHASYAYSARRYQGDYQIDIDAWLNSRMFDLANLNQQKAKVWFDWDINEYVTISPSAGLLWNEYPETTQLQTGVSRENSWNAGIQIAFRPLSNLKLMVGYNYEQQIMDMTAVVPDAVGAAPGNICNFPGFPPPDFNPYTVPSPCRWSDNMADTYHALLASADWKAIPGKLDFRVNYIASWGLETHDFTPCSSNNVNCNGVSVLGTPSGSVTAAQVGLPWPDNTNLFQRLDVTGRYYFDKDFVERLGWKGAVYFKLRYTYERNQGLYWQSDTVNAYFGTLTGNNELTGTSRSLWLAYNNPNYTAQLIAASLNFKW